MTNRIDIITSDNLNDLKHHILELSKKGSASLTSSDRL